MKVSRSVRGSSAIGRTVITVALSAVILLVTGVANVHAITRPEVLKRAEHWIKKRVQYSQSSYYQGYRRDCSGFVSMAWKLKTSYTSSTISSAAKTEVVPPKRVSPTPPPAVVPAPLPSNLPTSTESSASTLTASPVGSLAPIR